MSKPVKIVIALAIGLAAVLATKAARLKTMASKLSVKLVGFGTPKFSSGLMTVPLTARIVNQTSESLSIDRVQVWLSYFSQKTYKLVGQADIDGFTILPGEIFKTFLAQANLKTITDDFLNTISILFTLKSVNIKADVVITVAGVQLPAQTFTQNVQL